MMSDSNSASVASKGKTGTQQRRRPGAGAKKLAPIEDGNLTNQKPRKILEKKDLIEAVRKMAPNRNTKPIGGMSMSRTESLPETSSQIKVMEEGVNSNARRYNNMKLDAERKEVELKKALDTLSCMKMENQALRAMKAKKTPESNRIHELEIEIAKANAETERKLHYRRQLEHMLRRLQQNQITFDAHINAMEEAYLASVREHEDIQALVRALEAGRTKAVLDLHDMHRNVTVERRERSRAITLRKDEAENAKKMEDWRKAREELRAEFTSQLRGDLSAEEERALQMKLMERQQQASALREANEEKQRALAKLEEQFTNIRQATGVNSLEEMVEKFLGQEGNRDQLQDEQADVDNRREEAKRRKEAAEQRFTELKAGETGPEAIGHGDLEHDIQSAIEGKILSQTTDLKVARAACERLGAVLVSLRQGAVGLFQRLSTFMYLLESEGLSFGDMSTMESYEAIGLAEQILSKMMESVGGGEASPSRFGMAVPDGLSEDDDAPNSVRDEASTWSSLGADDFPNPRNNVRVKSIVEQKRMEEHEDYDSATPAGPVDEASEDLDRSDAEGTMDMVPGREFLKLNANRGYAENIRKIEFEKRRKKMQERLEAADDNERNNMQSTAARKKQQRDKVNQLAERPEIVGMPKGITRKDEPLKRATAFLTQGPELL